MLSATITNVAYASAYGTVLRWAYAATP